MDASKASRMALLSNRVLSSSNLVAILPSFVTRLAIFTGIVALFRKAWPQPDTLTSLSNGKKAKIKSNGIQQTLSRKARKAQENKVASNKQTKTRKSVPKDIAQNRISSLDAPKNDHKDEPQSLDKKESEERDQLQQETKRLRKVIENTQKLLEAEKLEHRSTKQRLDVEKSKVQDLEEQLSELNLKYQIAKEDLEKIQLEQEASENCLRQTFTEMATELQELQQKLGTKSEVQNEKLRLADENERKLSDLRQGLAALLPDIDRSEFLDSDLEDLWVQRYLMAVKHLSKTVEELRQVQSHTTVLSKKPRVSSPAHNSRSTKVGTRITRQPDKKTAETKLLEALALFCLRCLD